MLALAGCSVAPSGDPDTQTESTGAATETGPPACDPLACNSDCEGEVDECLQPLIDGCSAAGECECVQAEECPPCNEAECGPWESCTDPTGYCDLDCLATIQPVIDPPGSCQIQLVDFPDVLTGFVYLRVDDSIHQPTYDCADETQEEFPFWVWLVEGETMLLCDKLCSLVEAAAEVEVGVMCESA